VLILDALLKTEHSYDMIPPIVRGRMAESAENTGFEAWILTRVAEQGA